MYCTVLKYFYLCVSIERSPEPGLESFGVSRKFASGKQAKKAAEAIAAERELYEEAMKHSEESIKTREILGELHPSPHLNYFHRHEDRRGRRAKRLSLVTLGARRSQIIHIHRGIGVFL